MNAGGNRDAIDRYNRRAGLLGGRYGLHHAQESLKGRQERFLSFDALTFRITSAPAFPGNMKSMQYRLAERKILELVGRGTRPARIREQVRVSKRMFRSVMTEHGLHWQAGHYRQGERKSAWGYGKKG